MIISLVCNDRTVDRNQSCVDFFFFFNCIQKSMSQLTSHRSRTWTCVQKSTCSNTCIMEVGAGEGGGRKVFIPLNEHCTFFIIHSFAFIHSFIGE